MMGPRWPWLNATGRARVNRLRATVTLASRVSWFPNLACLAGGLALVIGLASACRRVGDRRHHAFDTERIVSLSPAVTETLFAMGLGAQVVAVSDYCHEPKEVERLARVGTIFTPRFEPIVAARPTVILAERIEGTNVRDLERLSQTETYRWLSYDDVVTSTRALGKRFTRSVEAERLVDAYQRAFATEGGERGPRVLLALPHVPGQLTEIWYIRRNSIHGRALEAAGATNAVSEEVLGPPRMGLERAIALDPDRVIILQPAERGDPTLVEDFRRLAGMRAVRAGRVTLVAAPELQVPGPRIVRLVPRLRRALAEEPAFEGRANVPADSGRGTGSAPMSHSIGAGSANAGGAR